MKLGTLKNNTRDGQLVIVSKCNKKYIDASDIAANLQTAIDNWDSLSPALIKRYSELNEDLSKGTDVDVSKFHSPLPRAYEWIDGSAYINHIVLVRKARNAEPPKTLKTDPLVYQGGSGTFLAPTQDIEHFSTDYGIDFEAEIAIITDDVPMGTTQEEAAKHIKLIMILNDVSLRSLIPAELAKNFGFFVSKPSTAFAPFAVTPDELGDSWKDGRINLDLVSTYNNELYGNPNAGPEMHFSFLDLVKHVTQTRGLTAGTIIGSGTVSNYDTSRGSSCLSEKRMLEKINTGEFKTPYMQFGDRIRIEMFNENKESIFGAVDQVLKQAKK
mmetsp:Transcript_7451/g.11032  ORF Transcript_7451/g.11032 Transcript_7451/m.11032 type:complete len:328 (+) Transcript_7451:26-1009(+)